MRHSVVLGIGRISHPRFHTECFLLDEVSFLCLQYFFERFVEFCIFLRFLVLLVSVEQLAVKTVS